MTRYETLILARPDITSDELSAIEQQYNKLISNAGGNVVSFDRWGKYRLTYPVRKNQYGMYILVRFELPVAAVSATVAELTRLFQIKWNEMVMRHVNKRLAHDAPLEYQRPEPLDRGEGRALDQQLRSISNSLHETGESQDLGD